MSFGVDVVFFSGLKKRAYPFLVQGQRSGVEASFAEPLVIAGLMQDFGRLWFIAGGWAIDLFQGYVTRVHGDIEIGLFRQDQAEIQKYLRGWRLEKMPYKRGAEEPWREGEWLELPTHQINAYHPSFKPDKMEVLLNERDEQGNWIFRRNPAVKRPLAKAILTNADGIPYLAPEIALLYKSNSLIEKNRQDFEALAGILDPKRREWLAEALEGCLPGHEWLQKLR
jgi:hypothetical protein